MKKILIFAILAMVAATPTIPQDVKIDVVGEVPVVCNLTQARATIDTIIINNFCNTGYTITASSDVDTVIKFDGIFIPIDRNEKLIYTSLDANQLVHEVSGSNLDSVRFKINAPLAQ